VTCPSRLALLVAGAVVAAVTMAVAPASAAADVVQRAGPWVVVRSDPQWAAYADQGLTTVGSTIVTRGRDSVPDALADDGWTHIGDPGSWHGAVLDAYQNSTGMPAKLFTVTTAGGRSYRLVHPLAHGEAPNNSFAAVAPGGRYFVSGEWGTMRRLLVFRLPSLTRHTTTLGLDATIALTRPVRDVQGCAFDGATHLLCSTNDPSPGLFPTGRQLLDVALAHPLDGGPDRGRPRYLGTVAMGFPCDTTSTGEVEGIDVSRHVLRVLVNSPCSSESMLVTMSDSRAVRADPDPHLRWDIAAAQYPLVAGRNEDSAG
jgi:hypothetical protein